MAAGTASVPGRPRVNLVAAATGTGGIARYVAELRAGMDHRVEYVPCGLGVPALSRVPFARQLPLAIAGMDRDAPIHFTQIVGAGALVFRRLHASVVTVHDLGALVWTPEHRMLSPLSRAMLRLHLAGIRRATRVIAVSAATGRTLVDRAGVCPERVAVIPEGVDHAVFRPRPHARREVTDRMGIGDWESWRTLLVVGSELPRKNVPGVLQALALLRDQGERVRLVKVGSAGGAVWRTRTLRAATELDVLGRISFVEAASDDDLSLLYSAADAYASLSHVEGFSLPTLEALACGVPTIVAPNGALPELVRGAGVVLRGSTASDLVEALRQLFADPRRCEDLRTRAIARARQYDWDRMCDDTLDLYHALGRA